MITPRQIEEYFHQLPRGWNDREDGIRLGDPHCPISGVLLCWMANLEAMERAAQLGCNLIICHEDLFFPPSYAPRADPGHLAGAVNRRRVARAAELGITILRVHMPLDYYCVLDDFAEALGLPAPVHSDEEHCFRIYEIEALPTLEYISVIKLQLGISALRAYVPEGHVTRCIGLIWGGLGLSLNADFIEKILELGPDCLIGGEVDEYALFAAQDAGVTMIETGHSISENAGLEHVAQTLRQDFPSLAVHFFGNPRPYEIL
jgi:putative NIF3 family GTP cyclohydrolase 1 type 2